MADSAKEFEDLLAQMDRQTLFAFIDLAGPGMPARSAPDQASPVAGPSEGFEMPPEVRSLRRIGRLKTDR
ncbi:hypothetical protein [Rhodovulum kholense]|uniref:hypothetical protein n=1 Tax=Rhodovulum kholense TaxID=453584 RepID=UPI001FEA7822|nr:hypothetical protein [Rhodovulum kholense]